MIFLFSMLPIYPPVPTFFLISWTQLNQFIPHTFMYSIHSRLFLLYQVFSVDIFLVLLPLCIIPLCIPLWIFPIKQKLEFTIVWKCEIYPLFYVFLFWTGLESALWDQCDQLLILLCSLMKRNIMCSSQRRPAIFYLFIFFFCLYG